MICYDMIYYKLIWHNIDISCRALLPPLPEVCPSRWSHKISGLGKATYKTQTTINQTTAILILMTIAIAKTITLILMIMCG